MRWPVTRPAVVSTLDLAGQTIFVAVAADATGAVAAHFTEAAVRIEKQHPIVTALKRGIYDHQTVGPNGQMAFAQSAGQSGKSRFREDALPYYL